MQKVIVYLDDPAYARQQMPGAAAGPTHWVLVACAPRMTHRISKWVSHSARELAHQVGQQAVLRGRSRTAGARRRGDPGAGQGAAAGVDPGLDGGTRHRTGAGRATAK